MSAWKNETRRNSLPPSFALTAAVWVECDIVANSLILTKVRVVEYGADKNGFQPSGEGITVAPPTLVDGTRLNGQLEYQDEEDRQPQGHHVCVILQKLRLRFESGNNEKNSSISRSPVCPTAMQFLDRYDRPRSVLFNLNTKNT